MSLKLPDSSSWAEVQDPKNPTNWVILTFKEGSKKELEAETGAGGRGKSIACLNRCQQREGALFCGGQKIKAVAHPPVAPLDLLDPVI